MAAGVLSMLVLPVSWAPLTAVLLGFGLGIFPLVMVMISRSGRTTAETTALSTVAQSAGYLLATLGPFGMGLLHSATDSWTLPLILLLAVALGQIAVGHLLTARPKVPRRPEPRPPEPQRPLRPLERPRWHPPEGSHDTHHVPPAAAGGRDHRQAA